MDQPNNQFPAFEATITQGGESGGDGAPLDNINASHEPNAAQYHISATDAAPAGEESTILVSEQNTIFQTDTESSSRDANAAVITIPSDYYHTNVEKDQDAGEEFESKQQNQDFSHDHDNNKEHYVHFPLDPTAMTMPPLSGPETTLPQFHAAQGQKLIPSVMDASSLLVLQQQEYPDSDKSISRKQNVRMNGIWQKHLEELKEFKERHGHVSVPRKSGPLGEWCRTQRRYYKMYRRGEKVPLTKERMRALEELGFVWFPAEERKRKREDESNFVRSKRPAVKADVASIDSEVGAFSDSKIFEGTQDVMDGSYQEEVAPPVVEYKTPELAKVHGQYNVMLSTFQKANESLCDAQDLLEKSIQRHQKALRARELAQKEMEKACDDVLHFELEQNPDEEWNSLYLKLVSYKEKHGDILFAKASILGEKSCANDAENEEDPDTSEDVAKPESDNNVNASAGDNEGQVVANDAESLSETETKANEAMAKITVDVQDESSHVNESFQEQQEYGNQNQVEEDDADEKVLADWVNALRKVPKKSIGEWRYKALDKIGFIWNQYDAIWMARYLELVDFKEKNGHARVPSNDKNLGVWVGTQRKQYRLKQKGFPSHMTDERIEMLDKIGFIWEVNTWNDRYDELKEFYEENGHFSVPSDFPNKQLRPWISTQRSHFRFKQENKPSQLTDERIELLNSIGFPWKTKEDWQTRFNELLSYYQENGNLDVPRVYSKSPKLYRWVTSQKVEMQKYAEGQKTNLKPDQIKLLQDIGLH